MDGSWEDEQRNYPSRFFVQPKVTVFSSSKPDCPFDQVGRHFPSTQRSSSETKRKAATDQRDQPISTAHQPGQLSSRASNPRAISSSDRHHGRSVEAVGHALRYGSEGKSSGESADTKPHRIQKGSSPVSENLLKPSLQTWVDMQRIDMLNRDFATAFGLAESRPCRAIIDRCGPEHEEKGTTRATGLQRKRKSPRGTIRVGKGMTDIEPVWKSPDADLIDLKCHLERCRDFSEYC